jgi:FeS assembly SUF system protein
MSIFSFLTGKRREDEAGSGAVAGAPDARTDALSDAARGPALPPAAGPASARSDADGWDTGSLTAPAPAPAQGTRLEVGPADPAAMAELEPKIAAALGTIFDPEIPVNIYELGLIYDIVVDASRRVAVRMTLTSPACPSAQQLPSEALYKVKAVPGVTDATVDVVWEPPWSKDMMSEAAKLSLGIF